MQLNGATLNGATLNSGTGGGSGQPDPVVITPGRLCVWRVVIRIGGVDVTPLLTGSVSVDREEGAAGVAQFDLFYPPEADVPAAMPSNAVEIDFIGEVDGVTVQSRLFTGSIAEPTWSATTRVMSITCTDRLQQRLESMSLAAIDQLLPGVWSADVFEPVEGRSRYDYAMERVSTLAACVDASVVGEIRRSSWFAAPRPHFVFGAGSTVYQSVSLELAQPFNATNRAELTVRYRYARLWQLNQVYTWAHPGAHSLEETPGFCEWRVWSTETPDVQMVEEAVEGSGQVMIGEPGYQRLPLSAPNPCGDGAPWINENGDLLLGFRVTAARRWVQTVTEEYSLVLATPSGQVEAEQVVTREAVQFEVEDSRVEDWESGLKAGLSDTAAPAIPSGVPSAGWAWVGANSGAGGYNDISDEARRELALQVMLLRMYVEILQAHRETTVTWSVPTSHALGVDLVHTLELDDQYTRARGKCRRVVHTLNMETGEAVTSLSIAVMRGGGDGDGLAVPPRPDITLPDLNGDAVGINLPTQIGGRLNHPPNASGPVAGGPVAPYDEALPGFSGNYSVADDLTAPTFPRRFSMPYREVPESYTDELVRTRERLYRVSIPNDLLEL
ncbi:hypothetical protein [Metapseudomonas otitidis]|uniref:hypothetical protein n=1 Tax=Metapseudomonas otitidis TaxID=319939 RepID=UPI0028125EB3|nr:hypothetical protein [Pseudomonas otitidis]WMR30539.1 hypothetical protein QT513_15070 [Pseudomonas otitidis]